MKAIAKVTSHMEDDPNSIWIVEGKTYDLELMYRFIDEEGDIHFVSFEDFGEFFKEVEQ